MKNNLLILLVAVFGLCSFSFAKTSMKESQNMNYSDVTQTTWNKIGWAVTMADGGTPQTIVDIYRGSINNRETNVLKAVCQSTSREGIISSGDYTITNILGDSVSFNCRVALDGVYYYFSL